MRLGAVRYSGSVFRFSPTSVGFIEGALTYLLKRTPEPNTARLKTV